VVTEWTWAPYATDLTIRLEVKIRVRRLVPPDPCELFSLGKQRGKEAVRQATDWRILRSDRRIEPDIFIPSLTSCAIAAGSLRPARYVKMEQPFITDTYFCSVRM